MRLIYITNARVPTERAHGYQICKMCEEFSNNEMQVELWVPTRNNPIKENAFSFYGLKKNFKIRYIKSFDFLKFVKYFGKYSFYTQSLLFFLKLVFKKLDKDAIVYTRSPEIGWLFSLKGNRTIYEAHKWPGSKVRLYVSLIKKVDKIVCNSLGTEKKFKEAGFNNTITAPNGVDLEDFKVEENINDLKEKFNLPLGKKLVMYIGHLYRWKGIDVIIRVAEILLARRDVIFILIGGTDEDVKKYKQIAKNRKLTNLVLFGYQKKEKIPEFLKCADILLLPNEPISRESIEFTSPIKMFEYMASKRPIVASDLPSFEEVLNKNNAVLVEPSDPESLIKGIEKVLGDSDLAKKISKQAHKDVQKYTWNKRAKRIIQIIYARV